MGKYFKIDEKVDRDRLDKNRDFLKSLSKEEEIKYEVELVNHVKQLIIYSGIDLHRSLKIIETLKDNCKASLIESILINY